MHRWIPEPTVKTAQEMREVTEFSVPGMQILKLLVKQYQISCRFLLSLLQLQYCLY